MKLHALLVLRKHYTTSRLPYRLQGKHATILEATDVGRMWMRWSDDAVDQLYEVIGERIRAARAHAGTTQTELGQRVGLTRSSIANIEAGRQRAMIHTLLQVADALEVALADVVPKCDSAGHGSAVLPSSTLDGQPPTTHDFVTAALRRASE